MDNLILTVLNENNNNAAENCKQTDEEEILESVKTILRSEYIFENSNK